MFSFKFRIFCFSLVIFVNTKDVFSQEFLPRASRDTGAQSVLSSIRGSLAVSEIISSERWQEQLNVSRTDVAELRMISSEVTAKLNASFRIEKFADFAVRDAFREKLFEERLSEILDPNQLSLRRVLVLKDKLWSPCGLFDPDSTLLLELGMSIPEYNSIGEKIDIERQRIRESWNELIEASLDSVVSKLSKEKGVRLRWLFGTNFKSPPKSDSDWRQIQVLKCTSPKRLLSYALMLPIHADLKLSQDQRKEILDLRDVELRNLSRDRTDEISDALCKVLSDAQRASIIVAVQRNHLEGDFEVVLSSEVVRHVGISEEEIEKLRPIVVESSKDIKKFLIEKEMALVKQKIRVMPQDFQDKLLELIGDVW
jgi:hypothetical protein